MNAKLFDVRHDTRAIPLETLPVMAPGSHDDDSNRGTGHNVFTIVKKSARIRGEAARSRDPNAKLQLSRETVQWLGWPQTLAL